MGKKAIAVISFGTTYPQARRAIDSIEQSLCRAFPDYDFFRAFTSGMVIKKIEREEGIKIPTPEELMNRLVEQGYEEVLCQSLHIMPGIEYEKMLTQLAPFQEKFSSLRVGNPMLFAELDYEKVCSGLMHTVSDIEKDTAYVYMGHGTEHFANSAYSQIERMFDFLGAERVLVGTVEGFPGLEYIRRSLKKAEIKKVILAPFMIVAGDHAQNDLSGEEEDSWKSILEADGYQVEVDLRGLGEMDFVQDLFVSHAQQAASKDN